MATSADYRLGDHAFPPGWFAEVNGIEIGRKPIGLRYFGQDLVAYRGKSGRVVVLDAFCSHMAPISPAAPARRQAARKRTWKAITSAARSRLAFQPRWPLQRNPVSRRPVPQSRVWYSQFHNPRAQADAIVARVAGVPYSKNWSKNWPPFTAEAAE